MKRYILPAITLAITIAQTSAQNYSKDVDVTIELQPEVRAASRLDISPATTTKTFPTSTLQYNGMVVSSAVTPMISFLPAVSTDSVFHPYKYRGYLTAGYFPAADFGVSAGYNIVKKPLTRFNIYAQLDRNSYKQPLSLEPDAQRSRLSATDFDLGLNFSHATRAGVLSAATSLYLSHFNYPDGKMQPSTQNIARYMLDARWRSTLDETASGYTISAGLDYFGYGKACFPTAFDTSTITGSRPLRELSGSVGASGQFMITHSFGIGLNASFSGASLNATYLYMPGKNSFHSDGALRRGVISLGAYLRFNMSNFSGHIGPIFDIGTGSHNTTHVGARGVLNWNISPYMLLFGTLESGTQLNNLGYLYAISRHAAPLSTATPAFLEGDLKGGLSIGPFKGFSLTAAAGYSSAANYALPGITDDVYTFATCNLSSVYYSVKLQYTNGKRFSATATLEGALSNTVNHAYYKWTDRARQVLGVSLKWRPIDPLIIEGGYDLRLKRKICNLITLHDNIEQPNDTEYHLTELGRINCGHISVNYAFNTTFGIFARIDGIGQKQYLLASGLPGQRLRGLAGFSLNF